MRGNMSKKKIIWIICPVICILLLAGILLLSGNNLSGSNTTGTKVTNSYSIPDQRSKECEAMAEELNMTLAAENASLALFFCEKDASAAIYNKEDGTIYYTNPPEASEDSFASPYYQKKMMAQFNISYYNEYVQLMEMDSYADSVAEEQFEFEYTESGVKVSYTLGETATKIVIPTAISEERFLSYVSQMEEKVQKKVKRNYTYLNKEEMSSSELSEQLELYPGLELHNLYILKSGTKDYLREEMMEYFTAAGYTAEEMLADIEENCGEASSNKPWFKITLDYRLEDDSFVAEIDPSTVEYNTDGFYLMDIELLPYFGAANTEKSGYMFVPDGSGALIYLNNGKSTLSSYGGKVYSQDKTMNSMNRYKGDIEDSLAIKLPVYGLKADETAWLAVIEEGTGYADITADVSGRTTSYNQVYAGFSYLTGGAISLGDIVGANSFYMYSKPEFAENYKLRFFFLSGEEADYSGMATCYQHYLEQQGVLTKTELPKQAPFYVEYIGAIDKLESLMGIKHRATVSLTTYEQAEKITEELAQGGVENIKIVYSGWADGGLQGDAMINPSAEKVLEQGGLDITGFVENMKAKGITVYPMAEFQYVYKNTLTDGYSVQSHAPRYFDRSVIKHGEYLTANGLMRERDINLISAYYVESLAERLADYLNREGIQAVGLGGLSNNLYSDYDEDSYTDRQMAEIKNAAAVSLLKEKMADGILAVNANDYVLQAATDVIQVPMDSNHLRMIDEEIPFYSMVLKGYMEYAGEAWNLSDDYRTQLLKTVESGAGVYFRWIYEDNSVLKDSDYDSLYSVNYEVWMEQAVNDWNRVNEIYSQLANLRITEHEQLDENVYQTTYEDGSRVVVNYSSETVNVSGVSVGAKDFALIGKGAQ